MCSGTIVFLHDDNDDDDDTNDDDEDDDDDKFSLGSSSAQLGVLLNAPVSDKMDEDESALTSPLTYINQSYLTVRG